ncbi:PAC2 family protein, partial [Candidatus Pacearchaeota archaeon]|nr:PAC2 family protein [Candidatus Pacearchaeota archaeon]
MHIELTVKPKSPIVIEGFPGFGLVGTIATEFLIEHLKAKSIGRIWSDKLLPLVAVHDSKIIQPLEIYFAEKENIVILHALSSVTGLEWKISEVLVELAKELKVKEIISIEGVNASDTGSMNTFYYTTGKRADAFN